MIDKNYPNFSWSNLRHNQIDILKTMVPYQSIIFKDLNDHAFNFICKNKNTKEIEFEVYTIPDQWLVGNFKHII